MQIYQQGDYLLILEPALCKGCNLCVKSCPTSILYLSAGEDRHHTRGSQPKVHFLPHLRDALPRLRYLGCEA
jgi:ferredoxin